MGVGVHGVLLQYLEVKGNGASKALQVSGGLGLDHHDVGQVLCRLDVAGREIQRPFIGSSRPVKVAPPKQGQTQVAIPVGDPRLELNRFFVSIRGQVVATALHVSLAQVVPGQKRVRLLHDGRAPQADLRAPVPRPEQAPVAQG